MRFLQCWVNLSVQLRAAELDSDNVPIWKRGVRYTLTEKMVAIVDWPHFSVGGKGRVGFFFFSDITDLIQTYAELRQTLKSPLAYGFWCQRTNVQVMFVAIKVSWTLYLDIRQTCWFFYFLQGRDAVPFGHQAPFQKPGSIEYSK